MGFDNLKSIPFSLDENIRYTPFLKEFNLTKHIIMKRITVNAYELALIMNKGKLVNVLTSGNHWVGFGRKVELLSMTKPLRILTSEGILKLESELLKPYLEIIDIEDNQIGIEKRDGKFIRVLQTGKYVYWNTPIKYSVDTIDMNNVEVEESIPNYILMKPAVSQYLRVYPVESYQVGILYVDGKYVKMLDPGIYYYWKTDTLPIVKTIDMRIQNMDVSGQELLTKDKAGIRVNFATQYQVEDVVKALIDTKDFEKQLYVAFQLTLREYVGTLTLDQLLANKEAIGPFVLNQVKTQANIIGIKVISGGIKDVILPGEVKEIMSQVLIAQKKAQANTIMRQEETASTRSLLNTAKLMEQNQMMMKLKEMEYMEKISEKIGEITINGGVGVLDQLKQLVEVK